MYLARVPNRTSRPAILLRESYRENGKVKNRTLLNVTNWDPRMIAGFEKVLKGEFNHVVGEEGLKTGKSFGVFFALKALADEIGLTKAMGDSHNAKLALFMILTRITHQGSRLSCVQFSKSHEMEDILGLGSFDQNDLYEALDYLHEEQEAIEKKLYQQYLLKNKVPPVLVLYDVTSSYFEGTQNELARFGYNRDGKKGKSQIVIGLLTTPDGEPLAVRVFDGNRSDNSTVVEQINLLKNNLGITQVVFVGDRGMVKSNSQEALNNESMKFITALTQPQTRTLIDEGILQLELFDRKLHEVEHNNKRYILMRNDEVKEIKIRKLRFKVAKFERLIAERNAMVEKSKNAQPQAGLKQIQERIQKNKLNGYMKLRLVDRRIECDLDAAEWERLTELAGCYTLMTDVSKDNMSAEDVNASYRQLQNVERDFRTMKTGLLEVRPIFLRNANRTRGHVFVTMLALKVARLAQEKLKQAGSAYNLKAAMELLAQYTLMEQEVNGTQFVFFPQPSDNQAAIFQAFGLALPTRNKTTGIPVTKKTNVVRTKKQAKAIQA